jgi:hypothetical protein
MEQPFEPTPGSPKAVARGCTCSPVLNRHGLGTLHGEPRFYRAKDCPIHGGRARADADEAPARNYDPKR